MSAVRAVEPLEEVPERPGSPDSLVVRLERLLAEFAAAAADAEAVSDAVRIDRIAGLERLRAATAGLQMAESVRFARSQVAEQMAAEVHPTRIGQGIAEQLGLACRVSPVAGARRLGVARALWFDLPQTYAAVLAGELREQVAELVVSETRHLDSEVRRRVDAQIMAAGITGMGYGEAAACARKHAYEADRQGYLERGRNERKHRRVGSRPAPDTMSVLSGYVPVEQGAACYAALRKHTDTQVAAGDERTRDQIMADTFVERLTGQAEAGDVDVEVQITIPLGALLDPTTTPTQTRPRPGPGGRPRCRRAVPPPPPRSTGSTGRGPGRHGESGRLRAAAGRSGPRADHDQLRAGSGCDACSPARAGSWSVGTRPGAGSTAGWRN